MPQSADGARRLGLFSAASLVVANMIGVGVFTTSGFLLADLKSPWLVLLAWTVGGAMALAGALSYGALARAVPESGGEYLFLTRTVHPAAGHLAGWVSLLAGFSAPIAAAGQAFGKYAQLWFPDFHPLLSGSALLIAFAAAHAWRVEGGAGIQNAAVALKLTAIGVLIVFGLSRLGGHVAAPSGTVATSGAFAVSLVWTSFSYAGWNAAVYVGGEIRDPDRNLPASLLLGTGIVILVYLAVNAVILFAGPATAIVGQVDAARIAARQLGGPSGEQAVALLIVLALATSVSSMLMAGPRVYARMAKDGCLPVIFGQSDGPPRAAILLQLLLALAFMWTGTFEGLLTYVGFTLNLSSAATVVGLILLRRRTGPALKVPGWPWIPGLFLAFVLWTTGFAVTHRPVESLVGFLTLGLGCLMWRITQPPQPDRRN